MVKIVKGLSENHTKGEKTIYSRIKSTLKDSEKVLLYCEPSIGNYRPDFLLISPIWGVIIIEVKDYGDNNAYDVDKNGNWFKTELKQYVLNKMTDAFKNPHEKIEITLKINKKEITNPFDQILKYKQLVRNRIDHCRFSQNLNIPITQIVVFTNIPKSSPIRKEIEAIKAPSVNLMFEENLIDKNTFGERLKPILEKSTLAGAIPKKDLDQLIYNLIPTARLPTQSQVSILDFVSEDEKVRLLDLEQQKLAHSLGEGHRLVFGVAGSGKTVILVARARSLALEYPDWNILILCYNRLLARMIKHQLRPQEFRADITVTTFHTWAKEFIEAENSYSHLAGIYAKALERAKKKEKLNEFFVGVVPKILSEAMEDMKTQHREIYNAILIDEAQDFEEKWLDLIVKCLNSNSNSLLVCCDGLQGIYARKKFYWSDVGIQARGRVKKLKKSYRNPRKIALLGKSVLPEDILKKIGTSDEFINVEEFAGGKGNIHVEVESSRNAEYIFIAKKAKKFLNEEKNVAVLFSYNLKEGENRHNFISILQNWGICQSNMNEGYPNNIGVLIGTLYNSKGLEFDTVFIPEVDKYQDDEKRQLLSVGITRSRKRVVFTACKETPLVKNLRSPLK